jgi:hypothetical protein
MALFSTLQSLSQTPSGNAPDGATDAPSTIDDQMRSLASFIAIERDGGHQWGATVGGTANAITITVNGVSSLVAGQTFKFVAAGANTGAVTLNVNSTGAKNVNKHGTSALVAGDIAALSTVTVTYDGTNFQLAGVAQSASLATSGWAKFSNGLILQWGAATSSAAGAQSVAMPTTFPNAVVNIQITPGINGQPVFATTDSQAVGSFSFSIWSTAGSRVGVSGFWLAIGY